MNILALSSLSKWSALMGIVIIGIKRRRAGKEVKRKPTPGRYVYNGLEVIQTDMKGKDGS